MEPQISLTIFLRSTARQDVLCVPNRARILNNRWKETGKEENNRSPDTKWRGRGEGRKTGQQFVELEPHWTRRRNDIQRHRADVSVPVGSLVPLLVRCLRFLFVRLDVLRRRSLPPPPLALPTR